MRVSEARKKSCSLAWLVLLEEEFQLTEFWRTLAFLFTYIFFFFFALGLFPAFVRLDPVLFGDLIVGKKKKKKKFPWPEFVLGGSPA